ncbi:MAG: hypothetical protein J6S92_12550 [Oscillospiraceae bacterium]|nr:hypothetical protein [Oscillospiraceae bacterium]
MNILYEPFPVSITADGHEYTVLTDFREWLRFAEMMTDKSIAAEERAFLCGMWISPEPDVITAEMVTGLLGFYRGDGLTPIIDNQDDEDEEPPEPEPPKPPTFDWNVDARFVLGDFRRYYGIDLTNVKYLHWWHFLSLFTALPDDSQCMKRIAYRSVNLSEIKDKRERTRIAKIQRQIALPFEFDDEMIGAALWNMQ